MRSSKNRSRSKGNRNRTMGNVTNRVFDSSGPESKVRGTPQQIIDKYNQLTRDAQLSNDRVAAENFQQHAEHYTRMLGEALREQEAKRVEQEAQQAQHAQQAQARANRQQRDDASQPSAAPSDHRTQEQPEIANPPQAAPQEKSFDSVIDMPGDAPSGLVETPENAPRPKRSRTRKPAKQPTDEPAPTGENGPKAAE
jgi:uncharacterized protein DUF4167